MKTTLHSYLTENQMNGDSDINCNYCKSLNVHHHRTSGNNYLNKGKREIRVTKIYCCNECKRFTIKQSHVVVKKDYYLSCLHKHTEKSYMLLFYPDTRYPSNGIEVYFCLECGAYLLTCELLKKELEDTWPGFWQNSWGNPFLFHKQMCSYCSGENFEDKSQELSHAFSKGLLFLKSENYELFNFLFSGRIDSGVVKLVKQLEREENIYFKVKYTKLIYKYFPSVIEYLRLRRNKAYRSINEKKKELNQYLIKGRNFYREKSGLPKIGEGWISEAKLFRLVEQEYKGEKVYKHYHPSWLERLELDIYIPDKKIAIEYQGKQHYEPVSFFGGEVGFQSVIERDKRKKELCKLNSVNLIYFDYQTDVTKENLKLILENQVIN